MTDRLTLKRWWVIAAVMGALLAFAIGGVVLRGEAMRQAHWADFWWTIGGIFATIRCARTQRHATGRQRVAWQFFTAGCFSFTVGMAGWDWAEVVASQYKPFLTPGEPFFLLVSLLYVAGFVAYRSDLPFRRVLLRDLLNLAIVASSATLVITLVFALPLSQRGFDPFESGVAMLYPIFGVLAFVFGLIALWLGDRQDKPVLVPLAIGVGLDVVARTLYPLQMLSPTSVPSTWSSPFWLGLLAFTAWAAWEQDHLVPAPAESFSELDQDAPRSLEIVIPALGMLSVVVTAWLLRHTFEASLWPWVMAQVLMLVLLTWGLAWWNRRHLTGLLNKVQDSEDRVRNLLDSTAEAIYAVDVEGRITLANPASAKALGYSRPDELLGKSAHILFHHSYPDGRAYPMENCPLLQARMRGEVISGVEWFWDRAQRKFPAEYRATPMYGGGQLLGSVVAFRNISDRLEAEEALARSEARFRSIVQHAEDAIVILDEALVIRFVSPSSERMTGYRPEELVGRAAIDLVHPEDAQQAMEAVARASLEPSTAVTTIIRVRHRDGNWTTTEVVGSNLLSDPATAGYVCHVRDIGERLTAEAERRRLEEQLRQSQKMEAVGLLAGGIAHDFNNLLTAILGTASLLRETLPEDGEQAEEIREIETAAQRGASLTRQLLTFTRRQVHQPRSMELNQVITQLTHLLRRLLGEEIRLDTRLDPSGAWVKADPGQVEQVLMNLAVNARDAMPRGGVLTISTGRLPPDGAGVEAVVLTVADNGQGMAPEIQARAFEPFFTTKEIGRGSGLGLATVYGIVEQAGGTIELESSPGKGTIFRIRLPGASGERPASGPAASPRGSHGSETVLLVEDEAPVRAIARRLLTASGYQVLEAADAVQARRLAEEHAGRIDLLITDVIMPGMRGPELAEELVGREPGLRVLFISGYTADTAIQRDGIPGRGFIQKPFTPQAFRDKVRQVLEGRPTAPVPPR